MQLEVLEGSYPEVKTDVLVLGCFEDEILNPPIKYVDERLSGLLAKQVQKKQLTGEYKQVKSFPLNTKPEWVLILGLGKKSQFSLERLRRMSGVAAKAARQLGQSFTTNLHTFGPATPFENGKALAIGTHLGLYQFTKYKTEDKDKQKSIEYATVIDTEKQKPELVRGVSEGTIIADSVNMARDLVNTPVADLPPRALASEAKRILKAVGCSIDILDRRDMEKKGMNAIVGVGRGSVEEPQFIIIEYGPKKQKPIVLAGKGVCFDTGGYSLKTPYTAMTGMKMDMAGGAAVIAAIRACALLKVQQRIIGLIPAVINDVSGSAQHPDDIVKAFNGKTIEVVNTDAEGRLILADTLAYAETLQPQAIVDAATLTGACMVSLGFPNSGLFTRSEELARRALEAGMATGDMCWRLPMTQDYDELIKSDVADMRNIGKDSYAGAIVGAIFLQHFVEKTPWAHLDIAGPAFLSEEKEYNPKGASGAAARLFIELLQQWQTLE